MKSVTHTKDRAAWGSTIATRRLSRRDTGGVVTVEWARPRRRRTGEFECAYRVTGLGRVRRGRAFGEDGIQALQLVFEAVRLELEPHGAILSFEGGEAGETFFPQFVTYSLGGRFRKRLEAILTREIEREAKRLARRRPRR